LLVSQCAVIDQQHATEKPSLHHNSPVNQRDLHASRLKAINVASASKKLMS